VLENTNKLLGDFPGLDGLKTGYTHQAGFCLCATAKRDELRFLSVVLGCESNRERFRTSKEVLGRAFGSYVRYSACSEGDDLGRLPIVGGKIDSVSVQSPRDFALIVSRPDDRYLQTKLVPLADLMAPVGEGQIVGNLQILKGDQVLAEMPVVAAEAVEGGGIASWFRKQIDR
jgi:serine-type D-Ala-D-Ala carboxypeptidase (penicillin-binding protein 5/6)